MKKLHVKELDTPIGVFVVGIIDNKCCMFEFADRGNKEATIERKKSHYDAELVEGDHPMFDEIETQVSRYFRGEITDFDIPLEISGTDFQKQVWEQLLKIPYGETISYGELANRIDKPKAMRAVGAANGANSIAVIIPCHRVISSDGKLHGYGGGVWRKQKLLDLEAKRTNAKFEDFFLKH